MVRSKRRKHHRTSATRNRRKRQARHARTQPAASQAHKPAAPELVRMVHVLVPVNTKMVGDKLPMIADPAKYDGPPILTTDPKQALRYKDRTGPSKYRQSHPKLAKHFKQIRIPA